MASFLMSPIKVKEKKLEGEKSQVYAEIGTNSYFSRLDLPKYTLIH